MIDSPKILLPSQELQDKEKVKENDSKIETTVSVIEESMRAQMTNKTKIGGYGELHYNNIENILNIPSIMYM